ncbi:hypothetical protein M5689_015888 [Euphorbia peplus]|nr:hypothetical protein M5689_015888 [Euphorbia peplus]
MALSLGPELPSFRIYITDTKLSTDHVDHLVSLIDPAHVTSTRGLNFKCLGLQGKIKANVNKVWKQTEKQEKEGAVNSPKATVFAPDQVQVTGEGVMKEQTVKSRNSNPNQGFHNFVRKKLQLGVSR